MICSHIRRRSMKSRAAAVEPRVDVLQQNPADVFAMAPPCAAATPELLRDEILCEMFAATVARTPIMTPA